MKTAAIILLFTTCFWVSCKNKNEAAAPMIPQVSVVEAGQKTIPVYAEYVGQTYGLTDIEIKPRVDGWLMSMHFKEGGLVKKGQLLYVIQDDQLRDRVQAAEANLASANVMLVKAKSDLDRVKPLVEMNALSRRDLDQAQAAYDAQLQSVESAKAGLSNANTQLSYSRITAPISGTIGVSKVQVGDYVRSIGQEAINTISTTTEMRVRFSVTENDYLRYSQKMKRENIQNVPVEFILNDGTVFPESGHFDFANREVDPQTGSLLVQALVPNTSKVLRPGQYVKVRFKSDEIQNAVLVPQQAINQMQSIFMAFVVDDSSKVRARPVKTGARVGSNWVVTEGIKPGEKVALIGNALIKPGTTIKPILSPYSYDSTSAR